MPRLNRDLLRKEAGDTAVTVVLDYKKINIRKRYGGTD